MQGHVYLIGSSSLGISYIGSTTQRISKRWNSHVQAYRRWESLGGSKLAIYPHFLEHGIKAFTIVCLKTYQVADRNQLRAYEQLWINRYGTKAINKNAALNLKLREGGPKQPREERKPVDKVVQNDRVKAHYKANRERILAQAKIRIECECGISYQRAGKTQHMRTKKHMAWAELN